MKRRWLFYCFVVLWLLPASVLVSAQGQEQKGEEVRRTEPTNRDPVLPGLTARLSPRSRLPKISLLDQRPDLGPDLARTAFRATDVNHNYLRSGFDLFVRRKFGLLNFEIGYLRPRGYHGAQRTRRIFAGFPAGPESKGRFGFRITW
jgi:hypothetical protein